MKKKFVIGLDFGTKSARALLADARNGECIALASKDYPHGVMDAFLPGGHTRLESGWALQHPGDYIEALEETTRAVMGRSGAAPSDVIGLAVDFTACTMLPVDASLTPLCMQEPFRGRPHAFVKLWKHHGAVKETDRINQLLEERGLVDLPRFGGKISPELLLPKILQIVQEDPEIYDRADQILEAVDWLSQLLTGRKRRSASTAAYKMFWTEDGGYPEELFPALDPRLKNLAREKLAGDVCPVGGKFGGLTAQWAGRLGLEPGTAVGCGVIDSHAGLPGCGITGPGRMMLIIGTSSVQAALSEKPYSGNGIMGGVKNGIIPGFYAMESGLAAVGDIFEWFLTNSLPGSYRDKAQEAGLNPYRYLARLAERVPPGSGGLLALDWWTGNKTPFVDAELSGVLLGYSLAAKPEDLYRALVEATGFGTRMIMEYFEQGGVKIRDIVACGGIAEKDPFLTQIYADISDREIKVSGSEQTAALGAAMYASAAAGKEKGGHENILQAAASMSRILDKSYRPNPGHRETYRSLYREYRELSAYFGKPGGVMKRLKDLARQR